MAVTSSCAMEGSADAVLAGPCIAFSVYHLSCLACPAMLATEQCQGASHAAQIGYWRYISIYRHLQRNPDNQLYPLFEYFENWCQDENRHGDFFSAILKSQPQVWPLSRHSQQ